MRWFAALGLLAMLTSGCGPYGYASYRSRCGCRVYHSWYATDGARPFYAQGFTPAADDDRDAIARAEVAPMYVPSRTLAPLPPRPLVETPRVAFDSGAAMAAVHAVDLAPCAERGAPRGYGHAKITFGEDGRASTVHIDAPAGMSNEAVACLGEKLGAAEVPEFDGAPVTVGSQYLVK